MKPIKIGKKMPYKHRGYQVEIKIRDTITYDVVYQTVVNVNNKEKWETMQSDLDNLGIQIDTKKHEEKIDNDWFA